MADRYSGALRIRVVLTHDSVHYQAFIWRGDELLAQLTDLRRSRAEECSQSADAPRAYDLIARSALAFGDHETNGAISDHAEYDATGFVVRRTRYA
jgi:hypothetical protein